MAPINYPVGLRFGTFWWPTPLMTIHFGSTRRCSFVWVSFRLVIGFPWTFVRSDIDGNLIVHMNALVAGVQSFILKVVAQFVHYNSIAVSVGQLLFLLFSLFIPHIPCRLVTESNHIQQLH